jgi:hypothetical protein
MAETNNNIDNLSDVYPASGVNGNVSPQQLPIRGEKRIIPTPVSVQDANSEFEEAYSKSGQQPPDKRGYLGAGRTRLVETEDFNIKATLSPYVDYIFVRLYNRGIGGNGMPDGAPAVYRFLINPSQVVVNRQMLDGQALARSGWQVGVWGEDSLSIQLTGKTAGQYFSFGLTDRYQPFTESYRNLEQLQVVFENNGYWFEGEELGEGPLAANSPGFSGGAGFTRRIIKMHSDVELVCGNFIWYGMFESLTISQSADSPFLMDFQISFVAWKERFRKQSPYKDTIHNDVKRGHDFGTWQPAAIAFQQTTSLPGTSTNVSLTPPSINSTLVPVDLSLLSGGLATPPPPPPTAPPSTPPPTAPAVQAAQDSNTYSQVDPTANDTTYSTPVLALASPFTVGFWKHVISPLSFGGGGKTT